MKNTDEYINGIELTCDLSEVNLSEEDIMIRKNLVKFLDESINVITNLKQDDYELSEKQQINKLIQNGLLYIIDNLELSNLKVYNSLHEYVDRSNNQRYNNDTISLVLLNLLVQTVDSNCRVIDFKGEKYG